MDEAAPKVEREGRVGAAEAGYEVVFPSPDGLLSSVGAV